MKKYSKLLFLPVMVLGFFAIILLFNGCKKVAPATCSAAISDGCGDTWQYCTSPTQSYYTYKGKKYVCKDDDCEDAAYELAVDLMSCSSIDPNAMTAKIKTEELLKVALILKDSNLPCEEF